MTTQIVPSTPIHLPRGPRTAPPCAMVIFGASGDLTHRKLIPALFRLKSTGAIGDAFAVVGVARRVWNSDAFRSGLEAAVREHSKGSAFDDGKWSEFAKHAHWVTGIFDDPATYELLKQELARLDESQGLEGSRLFYLATPPTEFRTILTHLKEAGLLAVPHGTPWTRVIIEKPFGRDLESARALNALTAQVLHESQTYRIDHYLGKETVQNILVFRFANSMFEPLWNRKYIDHVQICAAETVGVETRGQFYEQNGVLRDIVQNHMLEVLSLVGMEPPTTGGADDIRRGHDAKVHARAWIACRSLLAGDSRGGPSACVQNRLQACSYIGCR